MIKISINTPLFILLYGFWLFLHDTINFNVLITGFFLCIFIVWFSNRILYGFNGAKLKAPAPWRLIWFFSIVFIEIFHSAYQHMIRIITLKETPVIFKVDLSTDDPVIVTFISNAITLTPGTLTLDADRNQLTVLGFAKSAEEIDKMKKTIVEKFQKPFTWR